MAMANAPMNGDGVMPCAARQRQGTPLRRPVTASAQHRLQVTAQAVCGELILGDELSWRADNGLAPAPMQLIQQRRQRRILAANPASTCTSPGRITFTAPGAQSAGVPTVATRLPPRWRGQVSTCAHPPAAAASVLAMKHRHRGWLHGQLAGTAVQPSGAAC